MHKIDSLKKILFLSPLLLLLYFLVPSSDPYVVISAISDGLTYRVARIEVATIPLVEALVRTDNSDFAKHRGDKERPLFTGILEPAEGSLVSYRYAAGKVSIIVDGGEISAGVLRFSDSSTHTLSKRATFVIDMDTTTLRALPIAGPAEIGLEFGKIIPRGGVIPFRPFMSEGNILVFGRGRFEPYKGNLYPILDATFPLPAGGRLSSGDTLLPNVPTEAKPWFGIAQITPAGFSISATTISSSLQLYRMGATGESETIALSTLTQAFSDPVFQWVVIFIGCLPAIQMLFIFFESFHSYKEKIARHEQSIKNFFTKYFNIILRPR